MNTHDGYSKKTLDNTRVLLAGGGDHLLGNATGNIPLSNGTVNVDLNADLLDGYHLSSFLPKLRYGGTSSARWFKVRLNVGYGSMFSITVKVNGGYKHKIFEINGYNYATNKGWHAPTASCIADSLCSSSGLLNTIVFGKDGDGEIWFAVYADGYSSLEIMNAHFYWGDIPSDLRSAFTVTLVNPSNVDASFSGIGTVVNTSIVAILRAYRADILTTARTINGTSFNGSSNIVTSYWGTARTLTIGNTGKSVNGSANVTWTLSEIGAASTSHTHTFAQITSKITSTNEFNFVDAELATIWFNYRRASTAAATTPTTTFCFGQGTASTTYASLKANGFVKNGSDSSYVLTGDGGHKAWGNAANNIAVNNSTLCTNLNADMLDGAHGSSYFKILGWNSSTAYTDADDTSNIVFGMITNQQGNTSGSVINYPTGYGYMLSFIPQAGTQYSGMQFYESSSHSLSVRSKWGNDWGAWRTILDTSNYTSYVSPELLISGNTIAVKVSGVTSSYITVPYATAASKWSTARTLTIGAKGKSVDGTANVSWSLAEIMGSTAIGTTTKPIYWSGSAFAQCSFSLSANVNSGTANRMAYYSAADTISSAANIETNGSCIHILNDADVGGTTADTSAPFTIGTLTGTHIAMDGNEILAKTNATTPGTLYLQDATGTVQVAGSGGLKVWDINIAVSATSDAAKRTISSASTLYLNSAASTSLIFQKGGSEMARFDTSSNFVPSATNTRNLGSSSLRWAKLYIGTADSYGSATLPIYWNAGVPKATTYSLSATIKSGTANRMAWYKGTNEIASASTIYASDTALTINGTSAPANSGKFLVVGTSTMRHIYPEATESYTLGSTSLLWKWLHANRINLNRAGNVAYGRVYYYNSTYYTWVNYMSNSAAGAAPTGGLPSTTEEVSSWAMRSIIENSSGYGWIWEACTNAAASATSTKPTARMSLSSNTGRLRVEADASTTTCKNGSLIVSSALNGSSGNVAIELWRGTNASWLISNEGGNLHIRDNYTTAALTTYTNDNLIIAYNTGTVTAKTIQPSATNTYTLGTTSLRWKALYIGTANGYGSATQPIFWNSSGVPQACTYSLSSTVKAGTANRMARYDGANSIAAASTIYASNTALTINGTAAPANSGNFLVKGTSTMQKIFPETNATYDLGAAALRWRYGYFSNQIDISVETGTAPFNIQSTTKVTHLNADLLDGEHEYTIRAYPKNSGDILFSSLPYLESSISIIKTPVVSMADAPYGKCFGPITAYSYFYSDYIAVKPDDIIYGEIWAYRDSGASGSAGNLYYGIERYDRNKRPIASNLGCVYFVASAKAVPTDGVWHKYSAITTIPTTHTAYTTDGNTSDGLGVYYIKIKILVNHSAGTIPTYIGGIQLSRTFINSADDKVYINGEALSVTNPVKNITTTEQTIATVAGNDIKAKITVSNSAPTLSTTAKTIATIGGTAITASVDHVRTTITAGTAGTSSATSGATISIPYVTMNAYGHVTGYGTHTHTISGINTDYRVTLTVTSSSNTSARPLLIGYAYSDANPKAFTTQGDTSTGQQVYASHNIYVFPSTGVLTIGNRSNYALYADATSAEAYKIGHRIKGLHLLLNNGSGTGINDGYINSITFGNTDAVSYAGIYVLSSGGYGTKMIFGTSNSYSDGSCARMIINQLGNVGIGTMSPSYKLHVNGDVYAANFRTSSDVRLKYEIEQISLHFFKFKFKGDSVLSYGFIAQELEKEHPELVSLKGEYKNVNYNSALSLYVAELENKYKELLETVIMLKKEIYELKQNKE